MFKFLRELGGSLTSSVIPESKAITNTSSEQQGDMVKKNKQTFKVIRKNVVQELENLTTKYPYSRPIFLGLRSQEELTFILNHAERFITLPKRSGLPRFAGYAECTNAGKSLFNEDQAMAVELDLGLSFGETEDSVPPTSSGLSVSQQFNKMTMFGIFDGHAGGDVAVTVSHELPHRIKKRISDVIDKIKSAYIDHVQEDLSPQTINAPLPSGPVRRRPTVDRLITGAIEAAFRDMDANLVDDQLQYTVKGGCATIVAIFYANKLYVANAGDCRAVMSLSGDVVVMSDDFTPESERRRLQTIAERNPDLLAGEFCPRQFTHRLGRKDIGSQTLYRDSTMEGWALKTVTEEDLRFPMIMGDGRRSRLLATIGLTRGLGDHNLRVFDSGVMIKPFLSCVPEVKIHDFSAGSAKLGAGDMIILGSDGLWDVITNRQAVDMVRGLLDRLPADDSTRYISAAQSLISYARGVLRADRRDVWVLKGTKEYASHDDISCFVIPLSDHISSSPLSDISVSDAEQGRTDSDEGATASSSAELGNLPVSTVTTDMGRAESAVVARADGDARSDCVDGDSAKAHISKDDSVTDKSSDTDSVRIVGEESNSQTDEVSIGHSSESLSSNPPSLASVCQDKSEVQTETNLCVIGDRPPPDVSASSLADTNNAQACPNPDEGSSSKEASEISDALSVSDATSIDIHSSSETIEATVSDDNSVMCNVDGASLTDLERTSETLTDRERTSEALTDRERTSEALAGDVETEVEADNSNSNEENLHKAGDSKSEVCKRLEVSGVADEEQETFLTASDEEADGCSRVKVVEPADYLTDKGLNTSSDSERKHAGPKGSTETS